ncbi:MAG: ACT domain-containing protein [Lachnospiraceae bacterium]|jgi:chorismate mutase|nr:ACT domain-containing protein [Lachnospiraceae bacterium]MBO7650974.1 ACT domain-containing protein [Lachnospiraceae bacterium]MCR5531851.1 ACT domain-containing protein [Lachnospiraceae bacterium]
MGPEEYYIVKQRALPEVLLKVVEAKHRLACDASLTVQEVTDAIGLSRSSFYKYRDDIVPFHENSRGKTLNIMLQVDDRQGVLSAILQQIAGCKANVLTIQQSIPTGGIASVALGVEILPETASTETLLSGIRSVNGVHYLKILGSE